VKLQLLQPFDQPRFIEASVRPSEEGDRWSTRFYDVVGKLAQPPLNMDVELGDGLKGSNAFERCNLWLLYTALAYGADRLRFICLWNGGGGDGPGGTRHMHDEVKRRTGRVRWIDTRTL
jgi:hypothetical protein